MNETEKQVQKALGLLKTYDGYVKTQGNNYYDVYEVQDVTLKGAKEQMAELVVKLQKKSKRPLELYLVQDKTAHAIFDKVIRTVRRYKCNPQQL